MSEEKVAASSENMFMYIVHNLPDSEENFKLK